MFKSSLAALTIALILALGYAASGSSAQTKGTQPDATKIHAGQEVFERTCLQCHAVFEGQYSFGPNLYGETKNPRHKVTDADMRLLIENGKGKMPAMKDKVSSPEIDNLIVYIRSL